MIFGSGFGAPRGTAFGAAAPAFGAGSREVAEAAVAPTPLGDKLGPPEAGFEEAETVAQPIGARHGLSPRALPRIRLRPAPAFSRKHVIY